MKYSNFVLIFENPKYNKHIHWIELAIEGNIYVFYLSEFEILKNALIHGVSNSVNRNIWLKIVPEELDRILEIYQEIEKRDIDILLDLSHYPDIENTKFIVKLSEKIQKKFVVEITSQEQISQLNNYQNWLKGVVVKGSDSCGFVSNFTTAVLARAALAYLNIPVYAKGGIGFNTVLPYSIIGCSGVVFDTQLLLLDGIHIPQKQGDLISKHSANDTVLVGKRLDIPFRLSSLGPKMEIERLQRREWELVGRDDLDRCEKQNEFRKAVAEMIRDGFDESSDKSLFAAGQDTFLAKQFAEYKDIQRLTWTIRDKIKSGMKYLENRFPFSADSGFCNKYKSKIPLIQGPMAHISDSIPFATQVSKEGALPVFACGGKRVEDIQKMFLEIDKGKVDFPFGIGLIGFDPEMEDERILNLVGELKPHFVVIAGAKIKQIKFLNSKGIHVFTHTPSRESFEYFLAAGTNNFIFEGTEAGGHIGNLSLLVIIESIIQSVYSPKMSDNPADLSMVFAGGIHDEFSAAMIASSIIDLDKKGILLGYQMGTAYLATREAQECTIVTERYIERVLSCNKTVIAFESINKPIRLISNDYAEKICRMENQLLLDGTKFDQRTSILDKEKRGRLFLAAKGKRITFGSIYESVLEECADEEIHRDGAFTAGQCMLFLKTPLTIMELHEKVISGAQRKIRTSISTVVSSSNITKTRGLNVAIIGMGCILPDSKNISEFWLNVLKKFNAIKEVPEERWNRFLHFNSDRKAQDKSYAKIGGFITDYSPNPVKYRITPKSASSIDVIQFMTLDAVQEALEDSGYAYRDFDRNRVGVIIGNSMAGEIKDLINYRVKLTDVLSELEDIFEQKNLPMDARAEIRQELETTIKAKLPLIDEDSSAGSISGVIAGRVANIFNCRGGMFTVDATCASSLAALDVAVKYLLANDMDMVITGGADRTLNEHTFTSFCKTEALSEKGCFPFDQRAGGFVQGEGAGIVILRRLDDAIADGDKIYAVIKGIGFATDGKGKGISAPNTIGQQLAIERAYQHVDFSPDTLGYVEAHGTSTQLGDKTELNSLDAVWSKYFNKVKACPIGSIKSNIGHLKSAASAASLIKCCLSLKNKIIPATINHKFQNKNIDFDNTHFYINQWNRIWNDAENPRRIGINAFGFGGVDYHVILEEHNSKALIADEVKETIEKNRLEFSSEIIVIGAESMDGLINRVRDICAIIMFIKYEELGAFIYNCNLLHTGNNYTISFVIDDVFDAVRKMKLALNQLEKNPDLESIINDIEGIYFIKNVNINSHQVGFVFTGQGSQYLDMGKEIIDTFPQAKVIFNRSDSLFHSYQNSFLRDIVFTNPWTTPERRIEQEKALNNTEYTQPAVTITNLVYYHLLRSAGVKPEISVGHSLGEYSALYAGGYLDFDSLVLTTSVRGKEQYLLNVGDDPGMMAGIGASYQQVEELIKEVDGYIIPSNLNSYKQTVVSGDTEAIKQIVEKCASRGWLAKTLLVSQAFHSKKVSKLSPILKKWLLSNIEIHKPTSRVMSNASGAFYPAESDHIKEDVVDSLARHVQMPVRFIDNIENMFKNGIRLFIEIGPKNYLSTLICDILEKQNYYVKSIDNHKRSGLLNFQHLLGYLSALGLHLDWEGLYGFRDFKRRDVNQWLFETKNMMNRYLTCSKEKATSIAKGRLPGAKIMDGAFADFEDTAEFRQYITQRTDFIRDVIKVDFMHFRSNGKSALKIDVDHAQKAPEPSVDNRSGYSPETSQPKSNKELVLKTISELTGYPDDMLTLEMNLEKDLGVDSLKQLDIYRKLAEYYSIDLAEFESITINSIGSIISHIDSKNTSTIEQNKTESQSVPSFSSYPMKETTESIDTKVLRMISDIIGYPIDIIDVSMDLEKDLGVDSHQLLDIYRALDSEFSISISKFEANDKKTIRAIIHSVRANTQHNAMDNKTKESNTADARRVSQPACFEESIEKRVIQIIARLTGYPNDMLQSKMDLEKDLGVDSLKQLELFRCFNIEFSVGVDALEENPQKTIESIIHLIQSRASGKTAIVSYADASDLIGAGNQHSEKPHANQTDQQFVNIDRARQNSDKMNGYEVKEFKDIDTICYRYKYVAIDTKLVNSGEIYWISKQGTCCILSDRMGVSSALVQRLRQENVEYIVLFDLSDHDLFQQSAEENSLLIDMADPNSVQKVLNDVIKSTKSPLHGFISLYSLRGSNSDSSNLIGKALDASERITVGHFNLIKKIVEINNHIHIVHASQMGGCYCLDGKGSAPETSGVNALLKTAKLEYPNIHVKNVDFSLDDRTASIARNLWNELRSGSSSAEVGYCGAVRKTLAIVHEELIEKESANSLRIDKDCVVIALGGAGGITSLLCQKLADRYQPKIYLIGRTPFNGDDDLSITEDEYKRKLIAVHDTEQEKLKPIQIEQSVKSFRKRKSLSRLIERMRKSGSTVFYSSASAEAFDEINAVISEIAKKENRIDLIIDGIGSLNDKLIKDMTPSSFLSVYRNKVKCFANIVESSITYRPKIIINFSSVAGRYGSKGQANYAAGNEVITKMASCFEKTPQLAAIGTRIKSIIWGPWYKTGMTDNQSLMNLLAKESFACVHPDRGIDFVVSEICSGNRMIEIGYHGYLNNDFFKNALLAGRQDPHEMAGEIIDFIPYKILLTKKKFSLSKEKFIQDHVILGDTLIPGCYVLELFSLVSKILFPQFSLLEFRDVEFLIPVKFDAEEKEIEVDIKANVEHKTSQSAEIVVELMSLFRNDKMGIQKQNINFRGTVIVGKQSLSKSYVVPPLDYSSKKVIDGSSFYKAGLINIEGKRFHNIDKLIRLSSTDCITFIKKRNGKNGLFRKGNRYKPVGGSFMLRDASFQTMALWDVYHHRNVCIPFRIKKLEYYPQNDDKNGYFCHVYNIKPNEKFLTGDLVTFDENGRVLEKLESLEMYRIKIEKETKEQEDMINRIKSVSDNML